MTTLVIACCALVALNFGQLIVRARLYDKYLDLERRHESRNDIIDSLETDLLAEVRRRTLAEKKIADALKMVCALRDSLPRSRGAAAVKIFEDAEVYAADPPTREYGLITVGYDVETSGDGTMTLRPYRRDRAAESPDLAPPDPELFELLNFSREAVRRVNQPNVFSNTLPEVSHLTEAGLQEAIDASRTAPPRPKPQVSDVD